MEERKKIYERRFYPLLISEGIRSDEEDIRIWDTFDTLSEEKKESLLSPEVAENLQLLESQFGLSEEVMVQISIAVRELFFGELLENTLEDHIRLILEKSLADKILPSKEISNFITTRILTIKPPLKVEQGDLNEELDIVKTQKLQLLQALSEYPNLGNQIITEARIRIKSQPEPVRGSLYSWIKCYRDELGVGQHSTVERGQFLFRSENGKRLSSEERERINLILKSIEENYALDIDTEKQVIIFPVMHVEKREAAPQKREEEIVDAKKVLENTPKNTPAPTAFFAPRTTPQKEEAKLVVEKPQENAFSSGKTAISNQWLPEKKILPVSPDFTQEAEKLKREPKPDWIKGAFTKESIPDDVKPEPIKGAMSFSLNHVLPVEQEIKKKEEVRPTDSKDAKEISLPIKGAEMPRVQSQPRKNQFHIRPVNRGDF